jgi:hypothetical protein
MITKIQSKNKSVSIPIRFTQEEKFALELLAGEDNLPLSTYIKKKLSKNINLKLKSINKSSILINKLKDKNIKSTDIQKANKEGSKFRKGLKLEK